MKSNIVYNFIVVGNHPILRPINMECVTIKEAQNIKDRLEAIGYKVTIERIN